MVADRWRIWIDRGGTFTDCVGVPPGGGAARVVKVLSGDDAPIEGIRRLLRLSESAPIPASDVRMGTTLATNALLERKGVPTGLVTTLGFGDLLEIGDQTRPELFELEIARPEALHQEVLEVDARLDARGEVLSRPDGSRVRTQLRAMRDRGAESLAIVLIHAHRDGALEQQIEQWARTAGFEHVSTSHRVAPEIGMLGRGDTTVVDAYLTPLLRDYLRAIAARLPGSRVRMMQSNGALVAWQQFRGKDSILSGPAAGAVACAHIARSLGLPRVVGFDMGGTSTDVCRFEEHVERTYETRVAGVRLRAPMLAIHTVAAGGGSLCRFDGHRLLVGPESAGASPGPLCYGHTDARELTVTDVNLALGRVDGSRFPFELRSERVDAALAAVADGIRSEVTFDASDVAAGFFRIAVENMAEAIRRVSVAKGHDVRTHALVVFGGAGGQHACAVARKLGIDTLVFHPLAGVLSAFGMGVAPIGWNGQADWGGERLDRADMERLSARRHELELVGMGRLDDEGVPVDRRVSTAWLDLRYAGTETSLRVRLDEPSRMVASFEMLHEREFGYLRANHPIEIVSLRVEVEGDLGVVEQLHPPAVLGDPSVLERRRMWAAGEWWDDVPTHARESLPPGWEVDGPALILEATGTIVVDPGWNARVDGQGIIHVQATQDVSVVDDAASDEADVARDPVLLELYNNRFMSIAEQMGIVLRRTALSTNIRERLDFSCAVFDREGGLVANAPHIPVHLGAMGESVRAIVEAHPDPTPGDVFATNDPSAGGSHLPDVTVVTPVHDSRGALRFFVASRGHHADIGGTAPGSMPPDSTDLEQEGVVLRGVRLASSARFERERMLGLLTGATWPARRPLENIADLEAQVAANRRGAALLGELLGQHGLAQVQAYMQHVQDNAAEQVAAALARLPTGTHRFQDAMDDGTTVAVTLEVGGGRMSIDFSGTGDAVSGNLNAPRAVSIAAVLYVLRCIVGTPIPLNRGCLRPIDLHIPSGSLLDPPAGKAVAAGNVETAQRVVDVLLGALGLAAASQGTMNNLGFGGEDWGYYETLGGGSGAGPGFHGASAVHSHMTNTRITDPEILESRFPVRLERFTVRRGSGGDGRWRGGDGLIRELRFSEDVEVSFLSQRCVRAPFGLAGGEPGEPGCAYVDGRPQGGRVRQRLRAGQSLRIETPGGGGFGPPGAGSGGEPAD